MPTVGLCKRDRARPRADDAAERSRAGRRIKPIGFASANTARAGSRRLGFYQICDVRHERGWAVPAHSLPHAAESIAVMRVVVKENFSRDMADMFAIDVENTLARLDEDQPKRRNTPAKIEHPFC